MDQYKIGLFLKQLRKEKNLTQEELAEEFGVSRRTVTRWETGYNMPDLSLLVEISDFYNVDLREIFNGERKLEKMNKELEETVKQACEYNSINNNRIYKLTIVYLILGIVSSVINQILVFMELPSTFWVGFVKGSTAAMTVVSLVLALLFITKKIKKIEKAK